MNKKELIDYLEEKKEYLDRMQNDFGNGSWWYSNRTSEDCINCKIHAWVDTGKVIALLTEQEREKIELLGIDIEKLCSEIVWGDDYMFDYSVVGRARSDVLSNLQELYPEVVDITYHGKQGGWACIQYSFDIKSEVGFFHYTLDDGLEDLKINVLRDLKKQVDNDIKTIEDVNEYYTKEYDSLCAEIEDPASYTYNVSEYIKEREQELIEQIDTKSELVRKIKQLQ